MTREELIKMTGSEEQADYALNILLKNIKPEFMRAAIKAEITKIENEIAKLRATDAIYMANGSLHANAQTDDFYKATGIIYTYNRTLSLTAIRLH